MKLVTLISHLSHFHLRYFNPHEREARDKHGSFNTITSAILIHTSVKLVTVGDIAVSRYLFHFNPHEREARDRTSAGHAAGSPYFNPHEREARD